MLRYLCLQNTPISRSLETTRQSSRGCSSGWIKEVFIQKHTPLIFGLLGLLYISKWKNTPILFVSTHWREHEISFVISMKIDTVSASSVRKTTVKTS